MSTGGDTRQASWIVNQPSHFILHFSEQDNHGAGYVKSCQTDEVSKYNIKHPSLFIMSNFELHKHMRIKEERKKWMERLKKQRNGPVTQNRRGERRIKGSMSAS